MSLYYASLAGAYRSGEMSVAYPLARSSPILVVMAVTLILGRGHQISTQCIIGVVFVVTGCFLIPMRQFKEIHVKNYMNWTCLLALLAAVGTAGYSIIDDEALRRIRNTPEITINPVLLTILYSTLEMYFASLWLLLLVLVKKETRIRLFSEVRTHTTQAVWTGLAIYLAYTIVLVAMAFARNVSYIVAFRQLSIPLGAALGIFILKEPPYRPKIWGVLTMFIGLVLVATG